MENNLDNGVYIVERCFEETLKNPDLEEAVHFKITQNLLYDYRRYPEWRKDYNSLYADLLNVQGLAEFYKHPKKKQEMLWKEIEEHHKKKQLEFLFPPTPVIPRKRVEDYYSP